MESSPSQRDSQIAASIPSLGEDVLLLRHMTAKEQIGQLFEYELELLSTDHGIKLKDVLGHPLTVTLQMRDEGTRFFNGHVARFTYSGIHGEYARYRATVRPWLWFLTLTNDCRIFQDMTVPEIVEDTFQRRGFADFRLNLTAEYRPREYATQYLETDFHFVSRLMENDGMFYYFEHGDGKHTMVICDGDGISDYSPPTPGYEEVPYLAAEGTDHVTEHISDWTVSQQVAPGAVHLKDFNFRGPRNSLEAKIPVHSELLADGVPSHTNLEMFDYPARYQDAEQAESYARMRMEEIEAQYEMAEGVTNARGLAVGGTFEMVDHPREEANREYVILSARYELYSAAYGTESTEDVKPTFRCDFKALDTRRNYRLPRTTPRPVVQGPQTAIVVGPRGEKVWPDQYGRVKVQFHWDRHGKADENSSCWIRVSQNWAGGTWGAISIPHIGHEVVVDFLEGDPDRPLITGRVYNADNMPPQTLPDNKYKSIIRDDYGNRMVFDATPDDEHIALYSPHHDSGLVLGRSVQSWSNSDYRSLKYGNDLSLGAGTQISGYAGYSLSGQLGLAANVNIASVYNVSAGGSFDIDMGVRMAWNLFPVVQGSSSEFLTTAAKDYIIGAGDDLCLAAGLKSANKSVFSMKDDIVLSVGGGLVPKAGGTIGWSEMGSFDWKPLGATAMALVLGLFGTMTGMEMSERAGETPPWNVAGEWEVAAPVISGVLALAYLAWQMRSARDSAIEPAKHSTPKAKIEITKTGNIAIRADGQINIAAPGKRIYVGELTYDDQGKVLSFTRGKIQHSNLEVLT